LLQLPGIECHFVGVVRFSRGLEAGRQYEVESSQMADMICSYIYTADAFHPLIVIPALIWTNTPHSFRAQPVLGEDQSGWRASRSTTMSSPLAPSLPCWMPTTTVLVRIPSHNNTCCKADKFQTMSPTHGLPPSPHAPSPTARP